MRPPWGEPLAALQDLFLPRRLFEFDGRLLPYFVHGYHGTYRTERCVEIPIALSFIRNGQSVLEVGNVLNHYVRFPHDTVDKYERAPGVRNEDIVTFTTERRYDLVLSVSTLEHVGWDETPRVPAKFDAAVSRIRELLAPGGRAVFTVPLGWNDYLDAAIYGERLPVSRAWYLKRTGPRTWRPAERNEVRGARPGQPYWCANAILVGELAPLDPGGRREA